jgi:hypothetical protein
MTTTASNYAYWMSQPSVPVFGISDNRGMYRNNDRKYSPPDSEIFKAIRQLDITIHRLLRERERLLNEAHSITMAEREAQAEVDTLRDCATDLTERSNIFSLCVD